ncbi:hypothetical protein N2152v2_009001 [Parachlorella kessleri]
MAPSEELGRYSTAIEALRGTQLVGRDVVLTGGAGGIGVETARALTHAGAHVIICARNVEAGEKVAEELRKCGLKGSLEVKRLDLADLQSIKQFADEVNGELGKLDLLILNAGVMALPSRLETSDGFEMQLGTNHIGHAYLTQLLLPKLKQAPAARVVAVSSMGHRVGGLDLEDLNWEKRRYNTWLAYGASKLANILFAKELASRMQEEGSPVRCYSLHPGMINTGLSRHMWGGFAWRALAGWMTWIPGFKTVEQGAATTVYAATAPELETQSGAYLSDCRVVAPSKAAQDADLAKRLWAKTEELIQAALKRREAAAS